MKAKRIISLVMTLLLVITAIPFTVSAADPEVVQLYGQNSVFLSSFGRMRFNDTTHTAFKDFGAAVNALTAVGGGNIYFTGTVSLETYSDPEGRAPIVVIGTDDNYNQNIIHFGAAESFTLGGDLEFRQLSIATNGAETAAKDAVIPAVPCVINTNGHVFKTDEAVSLNFVTIRTTGVNQNIYTPAASVTSSLNGGNRGSFALSGGTYDVVVSGAYASETVVGSSRGTVSGATVSKLVAGNYGKGTFDGTGTLVVSGGTVTDLYAGSLGGTVNGDIIVQIAEKAEIAKLTVGSQNGAKVNGNIFVEYSGGSIGEIVKGSAPAGKMIFVDKTGAASFDTSAFDSVVTITNGSIKSAEGGFAVLDSLGLLATSVTINGAVQTSENGVFTIPSGKVTVVVNGSPEFKVDINAKYVAGYEDGSFKPQNNMTRAEAVTLLSRLIVDENLIKGKLFSDYSDVAEGSWYEPYIALFENIGFFKVFDLTNGMAIKPTQNITRGEFVQLIYEIAQLSELDSNIRLKKLTDITADTTYATAIYYAVSKGYVTGYEDGTFKPENSITRAEVVTIVNRFLGRSPTGNAGAVSFSDIGTHWANGQILAACNEEGTAWTKLPEDGIKYVMPGTTTKENVIALYEQSDNLTGTAIREGVDVIANQIKKNITESQTDISAIKGKIYYVSEKNGNDDNDGLTPETAWQTLSSLKKARLYYGDAVLFERGGVYRGQIAAARGVTYGAYGEGVKPLLIQSKRNYADPSFWVQEEGYPNVWRCTLSIDNAGILAFDHDIFAYGNYDALYGQMMNMNTFGFTGLKDLKNDLEFFSDLDTNKLYVYSTGGNPGERFKSIEIGEKRNIFSGTADNVTLDNLMFKYCGGHGMAGADGSKNRVVQNCAFAWIGGSVLKWNANGSAVNYGNAIEVYGSINGFYIRDNWIWQIYDTGITHQSWTSEANAVMKNIEYTGNLIENCYWGIEVSNTTSQTYAKSIDGVHIAYNVLRKGGDAWGAIARQRTAVSPLYQIYGLTSNNKNELFEYNILDRSTGYLVDIVAASNEVYSNNIYIQQEGLKLGRLKTKVAIADYSVKSNLENYLGDSGAVVVIAKKWD